MNGSNLVTEADKKPFALCPICLRKLDAYCDIGSDGLVDRYEHLIAAIEHSQNRKFKRELTMFKGIVDNVERLQGVSAKKLKSEADL